MKITEADIEIVQRPPTKRERQQQESGPDPTIRKIVRWDPSNNHTHWGYAYRDKAVLDGDAYIHYLYKSGHKIWSEETKTGWGREFTEERVRSLVLLKGTPKFPITIGEDGLPVLDEVYYDMKVITDVNEYEQALKDNEIDDDFKY